MRLKQWLSKYLSNHAETNEKHWNEHLQTHYFKTTKDKAFQTLAELYSKSTIYQVTSESAEHGELGLQTKKGRKAFIVISIVMVKPYHTAIDFSVTTESVLPDLGYSDQLIKNQYELLKIALPYLENSMAEKIQV